MVKVHSKTLNKSTPPACKQTAIGMIPKDWMISSLAELAQIRSGIAKNTQKVVNNPISVHYLRVANVQDGYLDLSEMSVIQVTRAELTRYAVLPGDVLMNEGGDLDKLGRGAMWNGEFSPCIHQNHVFVVRCGSSILPSYLNIWTAGDTARRYFMVAGKQTTNLATINKTALGHLPVVLPPHHEQHAIAEALSDVDDLIGALDKLIAKKRAIKQAAMQQLLTGKTRLPGFSDEWVNTTLGEVIEKCTSGATPYRGCPDFYKGNIRWITSGELEYGPIYETQEHISIEAIKKTNLKLHPPGTFLMAITGLEAEGTRGSCGIVGAEAATNQSCMAIYPTEALLSEFLFHYYVFRGKSLALQYCQGTKQQSYTASTVKLLPILLPVDTDEQKAIAKALSDMDSEIAALEQRRDKTRQIKQGMMQALLTGRIRLVKPEVVS